MTAEALAFAAGAAGAAATGSLVRPIRRSRRRRPFAILARAGRVLAPDGVPVLAELDRRLLEAGRPGGLTPLDLLAAKLGAALAGAGAGLAAGAALPGRLGLLAALSAPPAGFFMPDLWLARRRTDRLAAVRRDLPALLDLLRVSIAGGASLAQALGEVGRHSRAPLAGRWAAIAAQASVGVPLAHALDRHRRELPIREVEAFAAAVARAARHGSPLADRLAAQARHARLARRRAVQEEAARAAPKMQLVVALLLVPSVMLLVAAALLSALAGGGAAEVLGG